MRRESCFELESEKKILLEPRKKKVVILQIAREKFKGGKKLVRSTVGFMQDSMGGSSVTAAPSSNDPSFIFTNYAIISAFLAFVIAQGSKFLLLWYNEDRWDIKQLFASGGMPSSHSATVSALAMAVGLQDGFLGSPFAIAVIFACVVMYDATGVRLHAGRQAEVLNQIVSELPAEHPLAESRPLPELLGHTPFQVAVGALLGVVTATIIQLIKAQTGLAP